MKFAEMCDDLLNDRHKMACRESYRELFTTVRVRDAGQAGKILTYYMNDIPQVPVIIVKEIFDSDDWIVFDDPNTRFNIYNFLNMPNAKEFILELWDSVSTQNREGDFTKGFTDRPYYAYRFEEAVKLGLITADPKTKSINFTDIGRGLVRTL